MATYESCQQRLKILFKLYCNNIPVCVRRWACNDFSLGNTRLQKRHLIALGDVEPSTIKFVIASALGLPLLLSCLVTNSGELQPLLGLSPNFRDSSTQFHGCNKVSSVDGVLCNWDTISSVDLKRFGLLSSMFSPNIWDLPHTSSQYCFCAALHPTLLPPIHVYKFSRVSCSNLIGLIVIVGGAMEATFCCVHSLTYMKLKFNNNINTPFCV